MNAKGIETIVNKVVTDYCEKKIGVRDVSKLISPLDNPKVYQILKDESKNDLSAMINRLADMTWYLGQDSFNHHDVGNILNVIDKYYKEIKGSKKLTS